MNTLTLKQKLIILGGLIFIIPLILWVTIISGNKSKLPTPTLTVSPTAGIATITPLERLTNTPVLSSRPSLQIVATDPKEGSTNIPVYNTVTITFNNAVSQNDVSTAFSPTTSFTTRIDNNIAYIDAPSMQNNTLYTITLTYAADSTQSLHFTTAPADSSIYKDNAGQNIDAWTKANRPDVTVYNSLPYSTADFSLQAVSKQGHYSFTVSLTGSDKNAAKESFLTWLRNKVGLTSDEIAKLDITYQ